LSGRIYEEAMRANALLKQDLMGMKMRVVVAEPYDRDSRYSVAYPMLHGPVVLIEGVEGMEGSVVEVEITRLVSNRMVEGSLSPKIRS
jgi:hypothetical protein